MPISRRGKKYVTEEMIAHAKSMDLVTYFQMFEPNELVREGSGFTTRTHDSLKMSNGLWHWQSRGIGGKDALKYIMAEKELPFVEAVELLCGISADEMPKAQVQIKSEIPKLFKLPQRNSNHRRVFAYLESRGISNTLIKYCLHKRILFETADYHNACFVGHDNQNRPAYAMLRGTFTKTPKPFKGEVEGSNKAYGFCIKPTEQSDHLSVSESPIDILSVATIRNNKLDCHYLAVGGVHWKANQQSEYKLPVALDQYLNDNPDIKSVGLFFDNDKVGRGASKEIKKILDARGYEVIDMPPVFGKDYNDMCQQLRKKTQHQDITLSR